MEFRHILLIRTDRIGDVVLTTPLISILHQEFPHSKIYFLTRQYTAPLLKHHDWLDDVFIYDPEKEHRGLAGHFRLGKFLKEKHIDIAFLFYPQAGLAFSLFMAEIPIRVGSGYRWFSFFLNHRIYEHRKYGKKHELEYNLFLLKNFIRRLPLPAEIHFRFRLDEPLLQLRKSALEKLHIQSDYLIIHPGSGGSAPNLPPEKFKQITAYLFENTEKTILIVGDSSEADLVNTISAEINDPRIQKIIGEWDLETYMAVISGSRLFISNSTGPLHIARAFNIPLVAFYCPAIPCSPKRWGPYNQLDSVITPAVKPCSNCNLSTCPYGNCLGLISWETIQSKLEEKIKQLF